MKKIKSLVITALAGIMMLSFAGCNLIEKTPEAIENTVYAKVGDTKIVKKDVDQALTQYLDYYKQQYGDDYENNDTVKEQLKNLRKQQLEALVKQEVLYQSADSVGVSLSDDELQKEVDDRIDYYKQALGTEDAYNQWLETNGFDSDSIQEFLKKNVIISKVADKMVEDVEVTDEDVQEEYDNNKDTTYTTKAGADVTHLLFLVSKDSDGNEVDGADAAAKEKVDAARQKALAGESLEDIAKEYNDESVAKYEDLGRVAFDGTSTSGGTMVQEFTDGFKNLPANQVSEPVKTTYGYHLIINTNVYPDDVVTPLDDTLKETIKNNLLQTKQEDEFNTKYDELKDKIKIKTYEDEI